MSLHRKPTPILWQALEAFRLRHAAQGAEWASRQTEWARRAGVAASSFSNWRSSGVVTASARTLSRLAEAAGMPLGQFLAELEGQTGVARVEPVLLNLDDIERLRDRTMETARNAVMRPEFEGRVTFPHYALEAPKSETCGALPVHSDAVNLRAPPDAVAIIDWSPQARELIPGAYYLIGVGDQILWRRYAVDPPRWEARTTNPDAHPTFPADDAVEVIAGVIHFVTPGRPSSNGPFQKN